MRVFIRGAAALSGQKPLEAQGPQSGFIELLVSGSDYSRYLKFAMIRPGIARGYGQEIGDTGLLSARPIHAG